ncbi:MAG: hypothetical protein N3A61_01465 [Ignavibacteria bacterium]|nr:hypothetical protein [Ignavibacteria bacterium]
MKIINKVFYFFLSIFILINSLGQIFLYLHLKHEAKRLIYESVNELTEKDLTLISLSKQDKNSNNQNLIWKEEYEFELNGKMYDIIKVEETKDSIIYYCINDEREEELIKKFIKHFDENSINGKSKNSQSVSFQISNIQAIPISSYNLESPKISTICYISLMEYYNSIHLDIPSPPPKIFI